MAILRPPRKRIILSDAAVISPDTQVVEPKIISPSAKIISPTLILSRRVALYSKLVTELSLPLNTKIKKN